ncbi:MAG TPA: G1 family glutamic endopeptidase [Streptosporangiaceae bacterium]|nr:G1 family glutamic endopeptidase [Streptosporangiaceae bacterium]
MNHKQTAASAAALGLLLLGVAASATAGRPALAGRGFSAAARPVSGSVRGSEARASVPALRQGIYAPGVAAPRHPVAGPNGVSDVFYFNWSGYAAAGARGSFTRVSGSWTVSRLGRCSREHQTSTQWVGFDGFSSNSPTVEQAGTISMCFEGRAVYDDWYEMFPTDPVTVTVHQVAPGDKISASVTRSGAAYRLVVIDATHRADSFSVRTRCRTCLNDSAEWINERDLFASSGYSPLSDYGTWKLTNGAATQSGRPLSIGALPNVNNITMVDATDSYNLAIASALLRRSSFTTTWRDSW